MRSNWWQLEAPNKYQVIEVHDKPGSDLDVESVRAIPGLEHNPGFKALVAKLKLQRAALETKLKSGKHDSMREVDQLQAGIYWAGWLESTVRSEVMKQAALPAKPRNPFETEEREFHRMAAALEVIGRE